MHVSMCACMCVHALACLRVLCACAWTWPSLGKRARRAAQASPPAGFLALSSALPAAPRISRRARPMGRLHTPFTPQNFKANPWGFSSTGNFLRNLAFRAKREEAQRGAVFTAREGQLPVLFSLRAGPRNLISRPIKSQLLWGPWEGAPGRHPGALPPRSPQPDAPRLVAKPGTLWALPGARLHPLAHGLGFGTRRHKGEVTQEIGAFWVPPAPGADPVGQ